MIWDSILLMTLIDLAVVSGFFIGAFLVYKKNPDINWHDSKQGFVLLIFGLTALALFFLFDLAAIHLLPLFIPVEQAIVHMESLHHGFAWVVVPISVLMVIAGAAMVINQSAKTVSELKKSRLGLEEELQKRKKTEKSLDQAQRIANLGCWEWDIVKNEVWWSDQTYRIFGLTPRQFGATYQAFLGTVHPEDKEEVAKALEDVVKRNVSYNIKHRIITPARKIRLVHEQGEIFRDEEGNPLSMLGTVLDITERERLEEEARHTDRMKTVGQLAGGVAHDFNNLLAVVYGNLGLLKLAINTEEDINRKEALRLTANSLNAAKSGASVVKRLLAFSRQQPLAPKKFSVNKSIENMFELLEHTIGETITVDIDNSNKDLLVNVDPGQFENAILNLALNSRDAMPTGGRLTIRTEGKNLTAPKEHMDGLRPGHYVLITVADTGTGMNADLQTHALEPFFTTKGVGEGSGLGLSSVFGFVKQSNGHLLINSKEGKGTIIQIYLPRVKVPKERKSPKPRRALKPFEITGKMLVVEDNLKVRTTVAATVEKLGFDVRLAANATEAFQIIENEKDITFLLSDIIMPGGMLGTELALKARAKNPGLPILLMTGYVDYSEGDEKTKIKGIKILQKPFTPEELAEQITLTCKEFGERIPNAFKI